MNREELHKYLGDEIIPAIKRHLLNLTNMNNNEWQPIETAPDCDKTAILLFYDGEIIIGRKKYINKDIPEITGVDIPEGIKEYETEYVSGIREFKPTHWMPLPNLPKQ